MPSSSAASFHFGLNLDHGGHLWTMFVPPPSPLVTLPLHTLLHDLLLSSTLSSVLPPPPSTTTTTPFATADATMLLLLQHWILVNILFKQSPSLSQMMGISKWNAHAWRMMLNGVRVLLLLLQFYCCCNAATVTQRRNLREGPTGSVVIPLCFRMNFIVKASALTIAPPLANQGYNYHGHCSKVYLPSAG